MNLKAISGTSIKSFFGKLVSMSLLDLGKERDNEAAGYITDVLTDFSRTDKLYQIKDSEGRQVQTIVDMLIENRKARESSARSEREVRKYVGDFSLFMSGVFRDYVNSGSYLSYYMTEGMKSYYLVSRIDQSSGDGNPAIFSKLSMEFEFYSGALDHMSKVYFHNFQSTEPISAYLEKLNSLEH